MQPIVQATLEPQRVQQLAQELLVQLDQSVMPAILLDSLLRPHRLLVCAPLSISEVCRTIESLTINYHTIW
jgi:hypothetical protein